MDEQLAADVWAWGYPLVTMEMTRPLTTNVVQLADTCGPGWHGTIPQGFTELKPRRR